MELGRLGADEHGIWLGAPPGSQARRGSEEPVTFPQPYVLLIPSARGITRVRVPWLSGRRVPEPTRMRIAQPARRGRHWHRAVRTGMPGLAGQGARNLTRLATTAALIHAEQPRWNRVHDARADLP
jgi:hypothetical protein